MKFSDFLTEQEIANYIDNADHLKSQLISKINNLPDTKETADLIKEIEELLSDTGVSSRFKSISQELLDLEDNDVTKGIKVLSRYIAGIPSTAEQRIQFFDLMKNDTLVDQQLLTTSGRHSVTDIIPASKENSFIHELIHDLSQISGYGVGKGEFLLAVLSKSITKEGSKGDLKFSKLGLKIEVKTFSVGGGRFSDRNIKPSDNYDSIVKNFFNTFKNELTQWGFEPSRTGINLKDLLAFSKILKSEKSPKIISPNPNVPSPFETIIKNLINSIFTSSDPITTRRKGYVYNNIINGLEKYSYETYVITAFANYVGLKEIDGVLMIDTAKDPLTFVFLKPTDKSFDYDLSLAASTIYPFAMSNVSDAYPQTYIQYQSNADPNAAANKQKQLANPTVFDDPHRELDSNTPELTPPQDQTSNELDRIKQLGNIPT